MIVVKRKGQKRERKEKVGVQPGRTTKRKGEKRLRSYDRTLNTIDIRVVSIIIRHTNKLTLIKNL